MNSVLKFLKLLVVGSALVCATAQAAPPNYWQPQIVSGANHNMALDVNGKVWVWGDNRYGQLGNPSFGQYRLVPTNLSDSVLAGQPNPLASVRVKKLAAGASHSLALTEDGQVYAWGLNKQGQLGLLAGQGTLFSLVPSGPNLNYQLLTDLAVATPNIVADGNSDGVPDLPAQLQSGLMESNGYLWGVSRDGGTYHKGTIYRYHKVTKEIRTVHSFDGLAGGGNPVAELVEGSDGMLYGTTTNGGNSNAGCIYRYNPTTHACEVVHHFSIANGQEPVAGMLRIGDVLYGTTYRGGTKKTGTLFRYDIGADIPFTVLKHFEGLNGQYPSGVLALRNGKIYGTTERGGTVAPPLPLGFPDFTFYGAAKKLPDGTVFEYDPGTNTHKLLVSFLADNSGKYLYGNRPVSGVVVDSTGKLVGVTSMGGSTAPQSISTSPFISASNRYRGRGAFFRLHPPQGLPVWNLQYLGPCSATVTEPGVPRTELIRINDDEYIGTSDRGGPGGTTGTVYRIKNMGTSWQITTVAAMGGARGTLPRARLFESGGIIFGTTAISGVDVTAQKSPKLILGLPKIGLIAAGGNHSLAVASERVGEYQYMYGWGDNSKGQLGLKKLGAPVKDQVSLKYPQRTGFSAKGDEVITDVAAGGYHSLVVRYGLAQMPDHTQVRGYAVYAAGLNNVDQMLVSGNKFLSGFYTTTIYSQTPLRVFAGARHSMVWDAGNANGDILIGGMNRIGTTYGYLGLGGEKLPSRQGYPKEPFQNNPLRVTAVAAGAFHDVVVKAGEGEALVWGRNNAGQLGIPKNVSGGAAPPYINAPDASQTQVLPGQTFGPDLKPVGLVSAGASHTLYLKTDGSVYATGAGALGQLGNGLRPPKRTYVDRVLTAPGSTTGFSLFNRIPQTPTDNDEIPDEWELEFFGNLTTYTNAAAADLVDSDQDGLTDWQEYLLGTNPRRGDSDRDDLPDNWELQNPGFNPTVKDSATADYDGDGLSNATEALNQTNPWSSDSNGNGISDFVEYQAKENPPAPPAPPAGETEVEKFTATIEIGNGPLKAVVSEIQPDGTKTEFITLIAEPEQTKSKTSENFRRDRSYQVDVNPGGPTIPQSTSWGLNVTSPSPNIAILDSPEMFSGMANGGAVGDKKVFLVPVNMERHALLADGSPDKATTRVASDIATSTLIPEVVLDEVNTAGNTVTISGFVYDSLLNNIPRAAGKDIPSVDVFVGDELVTTINLVQEADGPATPLARHPYRGKIPPTVIQLGEKSNTVNVRVQTADNLVGNTGQDEISINYETEKTFNAAASGSYSVKVVGNHSDTTEDKIEVNGVTLGELVELTESEPDSNVFGWGTHRIRLARTPTAADQQTGLPITVHWNSTLGSNGTFTRLFAYDQVAGAFTTTLTAAEMVTESLWVQFPANQPPAGPRTLQYCENGVDWYTLTETTPLDFSGTITRHGDPLAFSFKLAAEPVFTGAIDQVSGVLAGRQTNFGTEMMGVELLEDAATSKRFTFQHIRYGGGPGWTQTLDFESVVNVQTPPAGFDFPFALVVNPKPFTQAPKFKIGTQEYKFDSGSGYLLANGTAQNPERLIAHVIRGQNGHEWCFWNPTTSTLERKPFQPNDIQIKGEFIAPGMHVRSNPEMRYTPVVIEWIDDQEDPIEGLQTVPIGLLLEALESGQPFTLPADSTCKIRVKGLSAKGHVRIQSSELEDDFFELRLPECENDTPKYVNLTANQNGEYVTNEKIIVYFPDDETESLTNAQWQQLKGLGYLAVHNLNPWAVAKQGTGKKGDVGKYMYKGTQDHHVFPIIPETKPGTRYKSVLYGIDLFEFEFLGFEFDNGNVAQKIEAFFLKDLLTIPLFTERHKLANNWTTQASQVSPNPPKRAEWLTFLNAKMTEYESKINLAGQDREQLKLGLKRAVINKMFELNFTTDHAPGTYEFDLSLLRPYSKVIKKMGPAEGLAKYPGSTVLYLMQLDECDGPIHYFGQEDKDKRWLKIMTKLSLRYAGGKFKNFAKRFPQFRRAMQLWSVLQGDPQGAVQDLLECTPEEAEGILKGNIQVHFDLKWLIGIDPGEKAVAFWDGTSAATGQEVTTVETNSAGIVTNVRKGKIYDLIPTGRVNAASRPTVKMRILYYGSKVPTDVETASLRYRKEPEVGERYVR